MNYKAIREEILAAAKKREARFLADEAVDVLVRERATDIDQKLTELWLHVIGADPSVATLIAVGGYGRGELHPQSDIDVLILLANAPSAETEEKLSLFVTTLWDIGLEVGHSVRTLSECTNAARDDLTIATSLMESRLVHGDQALLESMLEAIGPEKMWPSKVFYAEKRQEQIKRHRRYHDTAYNLEPNVKGSPGGLRDIQMIGWVAKRHFGTTTLAELVDHNFLTAKQLQRLRDGEHFLWRIRFGLHVIAARGEDRLLFDHQKALATMLGYEDASYTLAVEQMMQRYYRSVMELSRLNEMLLQQFEEAILMDPSAEPVELNDRFQVKNGFLQTVNEDIFKKSPSALLELFLLLQQNPHLKGVSAYTVGSVKRHLHLIDDVFRQDPRNHRLFLSILRAPEGVTHELRRMNLYGVLGLYIPAFGRIVGRMQYDLFHAYTVDEHTLFVVSNLRRFALTRFDDEFPHCSAVMQSFDHPELAYLGGLFHDIAKGRGGDHSELGAVDAKSFCLEHGMDSEAAATVAWLVKNHLIFSTTAQKKDLGDPEVINEFAEIVRDQVRLDYLYVLTVADVRGTDPKLWNSWKAQLFRDLYELTKRALQQGLENPFEEQQLISEKKEKARHYLHKKKFKDKAIDSVWRNFNDIYFLRYRSSEIAWHTDWLSRKQRKLRAGGVTVRRRRSGDGIEAVLLTPRKERTFAQVTAVLDELGLTIVDARIVPLDDGNSIDTYIFMEQDKRIVIDEVRLQKIRRVLKRVATSVDGVVAPVTRPLRRRARMFKTRTKVNFVDVPQDGQTILELVAADRPGLLSLVGHVFIEKGINITAAKIMTIGERAEDAFNICSEEGQPLGEDTKTELRNALLEKLD